MELQFIMIKRQTLPIVDVHEIKTYELFHLKDIIRTYCVLKTMNTRIQKYT